MKKGNHNKNLTLQKLQISKLNVLHNMYVIKGGKSTSDTTIPTAPTITNQSV